MWYLNTMARTGIPSRRLPTVGKTVWDGDAVMDELSLGNESQSLNAHFDNRLSSSAMSVLVEPFRSDTASQLYSG